MESKSANHTPALFLANSGFEFNGFPSMGSWVSYGLGVENESLPAYVVLNDERGARTPAPRPGAAPFCHRAIRASCCRAATARAPTSFPASPIDPTTDRAHARRSSVRSTLCRRRTVTRMQPSRLAWRATNSPLACRPRFQQWPALPMRAAATLEAYGVTNPPTADMGRRCLLGRRLLEQGVRFVQLFSGGPIAGSPRASWDAHENVQGKPRR